MSDLLAMLQGAVPERVTFARLGARYGCGFVSATIPYDGRLKELSP